MSSHLLAVLLSWAVHLTDYAPPEQPPDFQIRPHGWFVAIPCEGKTPCRIVGWYKDGIVYLHEKYRVPNAFGTSIVVHEFVHYLQDLSDDWTQSCSDHLANEREAYAVQNEYLKESTGAVMLAEQPSTTCTRGVP